MVRAYLYAIVLFSPPSEPSVSANRAANRQVASTPNRLTHPRQLSISQREKIVKDGLGDREEKVRAAAGRMMGAWFDKVCEDRKVDGGNGEEKYDSLVEGLLALLKLFDLASEDGGLVAADALGSIFITRPYVLDAIEFQGISFIKLKGNICGFLT